MTVLAHRVQHTSPTVVGHHPWSHRAWTAVALVPVGWVVVMTLVAGHDAQGAAGAAARVMLGLLALAAPVAAVILSDLAVGARETAPGACVAASGVLFFLTLVALHGTVLIGVAYLVTVALCAVTLCVALPLARRHAAGQVAA